MPAVQDETVTGMRTPTLEELEAVYMSERQMYQIAQGGKWGIITVPLVFGVIAWDRRSSELPPFHIAMAILLCVLGVVSVLVPGYLAKRRSRNSAPWRYTATAHAMSFQVGGHVQTLRWEQVHSYDEGELYLWIYPKEGIGIPVLKSAFDEAELSILRDRLIHAEGGAARAELRSKLRPLLL